MEKLRLATDKSMTGDNTELRRKSGNVIKGCQVTEFLYLLMRDWDTPGDIQKMVDQVTEERGTTLYTNGWLAEYADHLAKQLKNEC